MREGGTGPLPLRPAPVPATHGIICRLGVGSAGQANPEPVAGRRSGPVMRIQGTGR